MLRIFKKLGKFGIFTFFGNKNELYSLPSMEGINKSFINWINRGLFIVVKKATHIRKLRGKEQ